MPDKAYEIKISNVVLAVKRIANPETHKEILRIEITVAGKSHGTIECGILTLDKDLQKLREHGTCFLRSHIIEVRKKIEDNMGEIPCKDDESLSDPFSGVIDGIVGMYNEYIEEYKNNASKIKIESLTDKDKAIVHIPIEDFKECLADSIYWKIRDIELRQYLLDKGYIKVNKGRSSNNVKWDKGDKDKEVVKRCVSFYVTAVTEVANGVERVKGYEIDKPVAVVTDVAKQPGTKEATV